MSVNLPNNGNGTEIKKKIIGTYNGNNRDGQCVYLSVEHHYVFQDRDESTASLLLDLPPNEPLDDPLSSPIERESITYQNISKCSPSNQQKSYLKGLLSDSTTENFPSSDQLSIKVENEWDGGKSFSVHSQSDMVPLIGDRPGQKRTNMQVSDDIPSKKNKKSRQKLTSEDIFSSSEVEIKTEQDWEDTEVSMTDNQSDLIRTDTEGDSRTNVGVKVVSSQPKRKKMTHQTSKPEEPFIVLCSDELEIKTEDNWEETELSIIDYQLDSSFDPPTTEAEGERMDESDPLGDLRRRGRSGSARASRKLKLYFLFNPLNFHNHWSENFQKNICYDSTQAFKLSRRRKFPDQK